MKQLSLSIPDELHDLLIREVGKYMADNGKIISISSFVSQWLIQNLNENYKKEDEQ